MAQSPVQRLVELQDYETAAEDLIEGLWEDPGICNWCFSRRRRYWTEYEEEVADYLRGRNNAAYEARGHSIDDDGNLLIDSTATSDADPSTYQEVVPPKKDARGYTLEPPRAYAVCQCGVIDHDPTDDRTTRERYEAVENITDRLKDDGVEFDDRAAKAVIRQAKHKPTLAGQDDDVLKAAVKLGLKHA